MKAKECRDLSLDELKATLSDKKKELFHLKSESRKVARFEKPHRILHARREIARMETIIQEKSLAKQTEN